MQLQLSDNPRIHACKYKTRKTLVITSPHTAPPRYACRLTKQKPTTNSIAIPIQAKGMEKNSGKISLRVRKSAVCPKSPILSTPVPRKNAPTPILSRFRSISMARTFLIVRQMIHTVRSSGKRFLCPASSPLRLYYRNSRALQKTAFTLKIKSHTSSFLNIMTPAAALSLTCAAS